MQVENLLFGAKGSWLVLLRFGKLFRMSILIVVCTYVFSLLVIAYLGARQVHSVEDYFVAGRRLPFLIAVPSIVATWYGAGSCMGVASTVYGEGVGAVLSDPFGCALALVITGLFFAGPLRRLRLLTVADILRVQYGRAVECTAAWLMLPFYVGTLAAQLLAMGHIVHLLGGFPMIVGILIGLVLIAVYTVAGGMWAVSVTDVVQLLFLVLALVILFPMGWSRLMEEPESASMMIQEVKQLLPLRLEGKAWFVYLGQLLMTGLGAIMGQDLIQRCLACRSVRIARWSTLTAALFYFILGGIPIILGLAGRLLFPDLATSDHLLLEWVAHAASPALFALFAVGLISAIMSTGDSYLLAGTSIFMQNVMGPRVEQLPTSVQLRWSRWASTMILFLGAALAFCGFNIFQLMVHSGAMLFVAIFVPVSAALYWPRANKNAALGSMLSGVCTWMGYIVFETFNGSLAGDDIFYAAAFVGGVGSLAGYCIIELLRAGASFFFSASSPTEQVRFE